MAEKWRKIKTAINMSKTLRQNSAIGKTAVKLSYLEEFAQRHIDTSLSTSDVVTSIVIPETSLHKCR